MDINNGDAMATAKTVPRTKAQVQQGKIRVQNKQKFKSKGGKYCGDEANQFGLSEGACAQRQGDSKPCQRESVYRIGIHRTQHAVELLWRARMQATT